VVAPSACGAEISENENNDSLTEHRESEVGAMYTTFQTEAMMQRVYEDRLRYAELQRMRRSALRRSRIRNTLRRAIEEGLRYGIEPQEVEHEFSTTLQQITSR
jgi:hypothetical protein